MLSSRYSAERCMNYAHRHQRLCKQFLNDIELANQLQASMEEVKLKRQEQLQCEDERENAYDDLILADKNLDDLIRVIYNECKNYDLANPSGAILLKVFPDEKFGEIIRLPFSKEIDASKGILVRIQSLGEEHKLSPYSGQLGDSIETYSNAINSLNEAIRKEKVSEAEVEIAKEGLIRQYEHNYLNARRKYGKRTAEKIFPSLQSRKRIDEIEETEEEAA